MNCKHITLCIAFWSIILSARSQFIMISLEGERQGKFKAESSRPGYTDKTEVAVFKFEVSKPVDTDSRHPGRVAHQPVTIMKATGASSPQYYLAIAQNDVLKKVTIEYYNPDLVSKRPELAYTIVLENVTVSGFSQMMGQGLKARSVFFRDDVLYDEIQLVFEKITITDTKSRISAQGYWNKQNNY